MGARVMSAEPSPPRAHLDFRLGRHLLAVSCVTAASMARAAEPALAWDAPAQCADVQQVMAAAAELTGQDQVEVPPDRRLRGTVEPNGPGWQLTLTLLDGTREPEAMPAPNAAGAPEEPRSGGAE